MKLRSVLRHAKSALAALGALALVIGATPLTTWLAEAMAGRFNDPYGDVLVVLVASPPMDGVLSESDHIRSLYTLRAWRAGHFHHVLISGNTSSAMRDFLASQGIPADKILLEDQSRSTHESAVYSVPLLRDSGAVVLLTSDYHVYRARRAFARAGLRVLPRPVPDASKRAVTWYMRWTVFATEMGEIGKIAGYWWKGWI